jgi:hypothetical protein
VSPPRIDQVRSDETDLGGFYPVSGTSDRLLRNVDPDYLGVRKRFVESTSVYALGTSQFEDRAGSIDTVLVEQSHLPFVASPFVLRRLELPRVRILVLFLEVLLRLSILHYS